jgi:uncharacterized protein YlxP (DUF503 family)
MVVGTLRFVIQIPGAGSLKGKRHVVRKVIERAKARFNVSIAEVDDNDLWQKAVIGVAAVGNDRAFVNEVLDKVLHSVDTSGAECHLVSHELELLTLSQMYGGGGSLRPERTLAEAEGLVEDGSDLPGTEVWADDGPTLEELEAAAEQLPTAPAPPRGSRRRR